MSFMRSPPAAERFISARLRQPGTSRRPARTQSPDPRKQGRYTPAVPVVLGRVVEETDQPPLLLSREPQRPEREDRPRNEYGRVPGDEKSSELDPAPRRVDWMPNDTVRPRRLQLEPPVFVKERHEQSHTKADLPVGDGPEDRCERDKKPSD